MTTSCFRIFYSVRYPAVHSDRFEKRQARVDESRSFMMNLFVVAAANKRSMAPHLVEFGDSCFGLLAHSGHVGRLSKVCTSEALVVATEPAAGTTNLLQSCKHIKVRLMNKPGLHCGPKLLVKCPNPCPPCSRCARCKRSDVAWAFSRCTLRGGGALLQARAGMRADKAHCDEALACPSEGLDPSGSLFPLRCLTKIHKKMA